MAQPLLGLRHRDTGHQVYRITGASPTALGDPLGTPGIEDASGVGDIVFGSNRAIQFQNEAYAAARNGVYKKDDPTSNTGPWSIDHTFTNPAPANRSFHIHGPYQVVLGDVPSIFVCWSTSTSTTTWNAAILNGNTDVWAESGEQVAQAADSTDPYGKQVVYRGVLYIMYTTGILTFDPSTGSFGVIGLGGTLEQGDRSAIGIFNDRLLIAGRNSGTGLIGLFEITGGAVSHLFDFTGITALGAGVNREAKHSMSPSPDGSVLYVFGASALSGGGLTCLKVIDTAGTLSFSSDLTSNVIPAGLQPGSGGLTMRSWIYNDQESVPGATDLQVHTAANGGTANLVTHYSFVNESTTLNQIDQGGSASWAFTEVITGGGERIFTPGELHIEIVERLATLGGEAIRFKVWGDPGPADKNVEFRFNTETEVPLVLATLTGTPAVVSGAAAAPTLNAGLKRLENVEADGTSIYEIVWDIATDGVSAGQRAQLVPRVFV